ncbi:hypothetical protein JCM19992_19530 [Thermostilla marina]
MWFGNGKFDVILGGYSGVALIAFALIIAGLLWRRSRQSRRVDPAAWIAVAAGSIAIAGLLARHGVLFGLIVPGAVLVGCAYSEYVVYRRSATAAALAAALEYGIPAATILEGLYKDRVLDKKAQDALASLQTGASLSSALDASRLGSADFRFAVAVGEQFGCVSQVLRMWSAGERARKHIFAAWISRGLYLLWLSMFVLAGVGLVVRNSYFFDQIADEFGIQLRWNGELVKWAVPGAATLPLLAVAFFPLTAFSWTRLYGALKGLPVQHRARVSILLALWAAVHSGRGLAEALGVLAQRGTTIAVRRRAEEALRLLQTGENWIDAMRRTRLLSEADARALRSVSDDRILTAVLERLSDGHMNQDVAKVEARMGIVFPVTVCLCAVPVGMAAISLIMFLIDLVNRLV